MGGIGKTTVAAKLVQQVQCEFEYVIWRSLRNNPLIDDILANLIQFICQEQNDLILEPLLTQIIATSMLDAAQKLLADDVEIWLEAATSE